VSGLVGARPLDLLLGRGSEIKAGLEPGGLLSGMTLRSLDYEKLEVIKLVERESEFSSKYTVFSIGKIRRIHYGQESQQPVLFRQRPSGRSRLRLRSDRCLRSGGFWMDVHRAAGAWRGFAGCRAYE